MEKTLMKKTLFWTAVSGLLYASVSFLLPLFTVWMLDQDHGGMISAAILVSSQLLTVGLFSVRTFQISDHSGEYAFEDYFSFRILSALLMLLVGVIWIIAAGYQGEKAAVVGLFVLYKWIEVFSDVFEGEYQKQGRFYIAGRVMALQNICNLLTFFLMLMLTKKMLLATLAMDFSFAAVVFTVNPLILKKRPATYVLHISKKLSSLLLLCLPAFLNAFLLMYLDNCSKFAIESRNSNEVYYAFSTLFMCVFVINLFASFFLKTFLKQSSDLYHEKRTRELVTLMAKQAGLVLGLTFFCLLGAQIIGLWLLSRIYHCELMGYRLELTILLLAGGVNAINSMLLNMLVIMRKQKLCFLLTSICAIFTYFAMMFLVTIKQQFLGAGLGYLFTVTLLFLMYAGAVYHNLKK